MLEAGRPRVRFPFCSMDSFNWPNPSTMSHGVDTASNRVSGIILEVKGAQRVRLTTSAPSMCRLSTKCESLEISQPHGAPYDDAFLLTLKTYFHLY
jgi:hypothetical protein